MKKLYSYVGPIWVFDREVTAKWVASTSAVSEQQAKNNLCFRAKRMLGIVSNSRVSLPGKLVLVEG